MNTPEDNVLAERYPTLQECHRRPSLVVVDDTAHLELPSVTRYENNSPTVWPAEMDIPAADLPALYEVIGRVLARQDPAEDDRVEGPEEHQPEHDERDVRLQAIRKLLFSAGGGEVSSAALAEALGLPAGDE